MRRLAVLLLMSIVCLSGSNLYAFSGGTGSAGDPYLISTAAELNSVGSSITYWASYFKLTANIDMSGYTGTSYNIIGNSTTKFTGGFDGNGYVISNLTYTGTSVSYVGLFGYAQSATIQNVQLTNVNISSSSGQCVGSLIGCQYYGTTTNCSTAGTVSASGGYYTGGLAGQNLNGTMTSCFSTAIVSGGDHVGCLAGDVYHGTVSSCYATGNASGTNSVGGLLGYSDTGTITNCYARGSATGTGGYIGGLVGYIQYGAVSNCYSTGAVTAPAGYWKGGLVGYSWQYSSPCVFTACFWNTQTSGTTDGLDNVDPDPAGITGETTAQMQTQSTFTDAGWDYTTTWITLYDGYPHLQWGPRYSGGSGTSSNPYYISSIADFYNMTISSSDWTKYFILTTNLDLSTLSFSNSPVAPDTDNVTGGFQGSSFKGDFNGSGYALRNITINAPDSDYVGVFGWVYAGAKVRNLGVENVNVTGRLAAGGMVGASSGQLSNCHTTGLVSGSDSYSGGLAGWNGSTITGCYSTCEIDGYYYNGGLTGFNSSTGSISNCYTNGTTNGKSRTGGLVGRNEGTISSCYTLGATQGYCFFMPPSIYSDGYYVGGLCGENTGTISSSYARGAAQRNGNGRLYNVGGLVGYDNQGKVIRCYSSGAVSGTSIGGLVGAATTGGNYEDTGNFWDTDTSGTTASAMGTGKTTTLMKTQVTFTTASWDFSTVWAICEGTNYPKLRWQSPTPGNFVCPDEVRMEDLAYMAKRWLRSNCASTSNCEGADLDMSGAVNTLDLLILADNWLQ